MAGNVRLPRGNPDAAFTALERVLARLTAPLTPYVVTNPPAAPVRSLDVQNATLAELRAVVGTLLTEINQRGGRL